MNENAGIRTRDLLSLPLFLPMVFLRVRDALPRAVHSSTSFQLPRTYAGVCRNGSEGEREKADGRPEREVERANGIGGEPVKNRITLAVRDTSRLKHKESSGGGGRSSFANGLHTRLAESGGGGGGGRQ